jgi:hypothetical protein
LFLASFSHPLKNKDTQEQHVLRGFEQHFFETHVEMMNLFVSLLFLLLPNDALGVDSYLTPYQEVAETYVEYPRRPAVQTLLQAERDIPPVPMKIWSTPVNFQEPLYHYLKGIVRRLDKELLEFHPHYLLADGQENGCRKIDSVTGELSGNMDNPDCVEGCTNHGRYCAAILPEDPELKDKITGQQIVSESLRRLCVW